MDKESIENFLRNQKELLQNDDVEQVYINFKNIFPEPSFTCELTEFFLEKLNPLNYMKDVPDYYLYESNIDQVNLLGVTMIGTRAFYGCKKITKVNLQTVMEIKREAFCGCEGLSTIELPKVEVIGEKAFKNCTALEKAKIAKGCKIATDAFPKNTRIIEIERKR